MKTLPLTFSSPTDLWSSTFKTSTLLTLICGLVLTQSLLHLLILLLLPLPPLTLLLLPLLLTLNLSLGVASSIHNPITLEFPPLLSGISPHPTPPVIFSHLSVEFTLSAPINHNDKYSISVNFGILAPINGTAPSLSKVVNKVNAAISKQNILGNFCTHASWSTAYTLYLDFPHPLRDLLLGSITPLLGSYSRPSNFSNIVIKLVSPVSLVTLHSLPTQNADCSIMGARQVYNQILSENEYWNSVIPSNLEHPLLVDHLSHSDQSHTHSTFRFLDFPNKRVMHYLTTHKWNFCGKTFSVVHNIADTPIQMCTRCQMWGH